MDKLDQLPRGGLLLGLGLGALGGGRVDGGLVVEAVEVAAGFFEFFDPFLGLWGWRGLVSAVPRGLGTYLK